MHKEKKHNFRRVKQVLFSILVALIVLDLLYIVSEGRAVPVLDTHGLIANQERNVILFTVALGIFIVIPVFIMLFSIAWRYRASNTKADYQPDFESHKGFEALWWGVPFVIIFILATVTVVSTHALDPFKPIDSSKEAVNVQVVALQWKWLFVYPDQGVATLNYLNIPTDTPINLTLTSNGPMNSFWVPALAGQVYAMSGMSTQLHMMADSTGTFSGSSANISGDGFADMNFKVNSLSEKDFAKWASDSAKSKNVLDQDTYTILSKQSKKDPETTYTLKDNGLYNETVMKYMPSGMSQ